MSAQESIKKFRNSGEFPFRKYRSVPGRLKGFVFIFKLSEVNVIMLLNTHTTDLLNYVTLSVYNMAPYSYLCAEMYIGEVSQ